MSKKHVLWMGYGDLAALCIPKLLEQQFQVSAVCRSDKPVAVGCQLRRGDLENGDFVRTLLDQSVDYIVITLSPGERSAEAYVKTYLHTAKQLRAACDQKTAPQQIIFVSSTSVYHQQDGEWVDENSATTPTRQTAQILLEAERCLLGSASPVCCLRFSGIYGEGRKYLIEQVLKGVGGNSQWTNRIHSQDCAGILAFLLGMAREGRTLPAHLLGSDLEPVQSHELRAWMADVLGLPKGALRLTETPDGNRNKRCDARLLRALGYRFAFPDYRAGYMTQLQHMKQQLQQALQ